MLQAVLAADPRHCAAVGTLALLTHRGIGNIKEAARYDCGGKRAVSYEHIFTAPRPSAQAVRNVFQFV